MFLSMSVPAQRLTDGHLTDTAWIVLWTIALLLVLGVILESLLAVAASVAGALIFGFCYLVVGVWRRNSRVILSGIFVLVVSVVGGFVGMAIVIRHSFPGQS